MKKSLSSNNIKNAINVTCTITTTNARAMISTFIMISAFFTRHNNVAAFTYRPSFAFKTLKKTPLPDNSRVQNSGLTNRYSTFWLLQFSTSTNNGETATHDTNKKRQGDLIDNMIQRIRKCNEIPKDKLLLDFIVDGECVGKVTPEMSDELVNAVQPPIFEIISSSDKMNKDYISLTEEAGQSNDDRTSSVMTVMKILKGKSVIKGWRDEFYPVSSSFLQSNSMKSPLFLIERAAAPVLGIIQYGVHINGLVRDNDEKNHAEPKMWIARRSYTKSKYPGMLDHVVAGGQPAGISLMDNVIKECGEEAGIPSDLAKLAQPVGAISYEKYSDFSGLGSIERSVIFCFDLYLPTDFVPQAVDGEVEEFFLWNMEQVRESMYLDYHDPIKPNCYLVIIDYLMRNGYFGESNKNGPDTNTEGYLNILRELRSGDCV